MFLGHKRLPLILILVAIVAGLALSTLNLHKKAVYHPKVLIESSDALRVGLMQQGHPTRARCESAVLAVRQAMVNFCPTCGVIKALCLDTLTPRQQLLLDSKPVDLPVIRIPRGVITFESEDPNAAQQTCLAAARLSSGTLNCLLPDPSQLSVELAAASVNQIEFAPDPVTFLKLTLCSFLVSCLLCGFLVWTECWHARFSHDAIQSGPQKFHTKAVPRIGGAAIACAVAATIAGLDMVDLLMSNSVNGFAMLALSSLPAFAGGLAEDLTKKVGVLARLMLTIAAGILAAVVVGAILTRLDVPGLDNLLQHWPLFAIAFTAFAVAGVANSINIIDGYNGLASGFSLLALCAYAWVAAQVGDQVVLISSQVMLGAVLGFFVWNWPSGKIFLGDGGAYLIGFWLAELGVLLVVRNPQISPWFPLLVMSYPIWETIYSIYRRRFLQRQRVGQPDNRHFHQFVYGSLKRRLRITQAPDAAIRANRNVLRLMAPWLIVPTLIAVLFNDNTYALMAAFATFCVNYLWYYRRLSSGT